jgi:hypothetical protein
MRVEGERLAKISKGESLTGKYADELRSSSGEVSSDLLQVVDRYDTVVRALTEFQPAVPVALAGSSLALDHAIDASGAQRGADALQTVTATGDTPLTTDQVQSNADKVTAVNDASERLTAAKSELAGVLSRFDDAGRQAATTIRGGFNDGLTDSTWDRFKYAFAKFLKILVKILTYIGMALAVLALIIPGLGPLIFALGVVLEVVALAADAALMAMGEGSWVDIGIAIAGLLTLGVGKLFAPAIEAGMASIKAGMKSGLGSAKAWAGGLKGFRGPARAVDGERAPLLGSRPGSPAGQADNEIPRPTDWEVPPNAKPVEHPDLGPNDSYKIGDHSWQTPEGVTYTRVSNVVGYKGVARERAAFYKDNGAVKQPGGSNGNHDENWKGYYMAERRDEAEGWADGIGKDGRPDGGYVLRYQHDQPTTIVTPNKELSDVGEAKGMFGHGDGPFMDGLGKHDQILRNPLNDKGEYEYVVPWSMSGKGNVIEHGEVVANRSTDWAPEYRGLD